MKNLVPFTWVAFVFLFLLGPSKIEASDSLRDQLAQYDRDDIHSIHKRLYSKEGRHELSLNVGGIFNNGSYALVTGQYQYHFFEALGLEAAAGGIGFQFSDDNKIEFFQTSLSFSPIYGKISWFTWAVLNFDLYTVGGLGVYNYSGLASGTSFGGNIGLGFRAFINEFLAAKVEYRDYIYNQKLAGDSAVKHFHSITAGISVLLPFRQDL